MLKFDLSNPTNLEELAEEYGIPVENGKFSKYGSTPIDKGGLEALFTDWVVGYGDVVHSVLEYPKDENGDWLLNFNPGDYIETVELIQNGVTYYVKAYCETCIVNEYFYDLANASTVNPYAGTYRFSKRELEMIGDGLRCLNDQITEILGTIYDAEAVSSIRKHTARNIVLLTKVYGMAETITDTLNCEFSEEDLNTFLDAICSVSAKVYVSKRNCSCNNVRAILSELSLDYDKLAEKLRKYISRHQRDFAKDTKKDASL